MKSPAEESISATTTSFPIPSVLTDLESSPYNLLPYPVDFDDDDEAARAKSFDKLVEYIQIGNDRLSAAILEHGERISSDTIKDNHEDFNSSVCVLFQPNNPEDEKWCGEERMQALYTLTRYEL